MAHFAKLDDSNMVTEVNVVDNNVLDLNDEENSGIAFLMQWSGGHTNWKQTSYNGNKRKNFAGVGFYYDEEKDAFIPPKPYDSWLLDEETCQWTAPIEYPNDGRAYYWQEDVIDWTPIIDSSETA